MNINDVPYCTGCMACLYTCRMSCISIRMDKIGHFQAYATDNCIHCEQCYKICPQANSPKLNIPLKTKAIRMKSNEELSKSSSGGLATAISIAFIQSGGIVYGAAFKRPFSFQHIRCSNKNDLEKIRKSKYVQSNIGLIYKDIESDLKNGLKILFIGTPCQVSGIINAFKNYRNKIYTIDLICHGVPSSRLLKESFKRKELDKTFDNIEFRQGNNYQIRLMNNAREIFSRKLNRDLFLKGFFKGLFNRDCCYQCQYTQTMRIGDLSIGDFWGINEDLINFPIKDGVSLALINTEKGKALLKVSSSLLLIQERPLQEALSNNLPLHSPLKKTWRSYLFSKLYPHFGFNWAVRFSIPEIVIKGLLKP